jgi:hypothetical protein
VYDDGTVRVLDANEEVSEDNLDLDLEVLAWAKM